MAYPRWHIPGTGNHRIRLRRLQRLLIKMIAGIREMHNCAESVGLSVGREMSMSLQRANAAKNRSYQAGAARPERAGRD